MAGLLSRTAARSSLCLFNQKPLQAVGARIVGTTKTILKPTNSGSRSGSLQTRQLITASAVSTETAAKPWVSNLLQEDMQQQEQQQEQEQQEKQQQQHVQSATPGQLDATRFQLDKSVKGWAHFATRFGSLGTSGSDISTLLRQVLDNSVVKDSRSAAFWAYHSARLTFFIAQAGAGLIAHDLVERINRGSLSRNGMLARFAGSASKELSTRVAEAVGMWYQDLENIEAGHYKLPWDMTHLMHRQYSPLFMLYRTALFMSEASSTLQRRVRNSPAPVWLQGPGLYPNYYTKTFHYQSDGWFSDRDAMQRACLVPISQHISSCGKPTSSLRLLEVAAGTGRFHTFIKDNWPEMPSVLSDLSPFYLAKARENIEYWRAQAQGGRRLGGGPDGANVEYLQTAAEAIAAPDESFDIVVVVYLFHELPEPVRRQAVSEFYRVLKPGGLMVWNDSVQIGDRPEWDQSLGNFGNFNEPFYRNYVTCDVGGMFEKAGFIPGTKSVASTSKMLSFIKPLHTPASPELVKMMYVGGAASDN